MELVEAEQLFTQYNEEFIKEIEVGLYGSFSWVVLACLDLVGFDRPQKFLIPYLSPRWFLSSYFFLVAIYFFYLAYLFPKVSLLNMGFRDQEPMELILSFGFLLFVVVNRISQVQAVRLNSG